MINTGNMKNVKLRKTKGKGKGKLTDKETRRKAAEILMKMNPVEREKALKKLEESNGL